MEENKKVYPSVKEVMAEIKKNQINENLYFCVVLIKPEFARFLLSTLKFNRNIKKNNIEKIRRAITQGDWKLNGETIIIDENGNLVNGVHRLTVSVRYGVSFKACIVFGVKEENAHTYDLNAIRRTADILAHKYSKYLPQYSKSIIPIWNFTNHLINLQRRGVNPVDAECLNYVSIGADECERFYHNHKDGCDFIVKNHCHVKGLTKTGVWCAVLSAYESGYPVERLERWCEVFKTGFSTSNDEFQIVKFREKCQSDTLSGIASIYYYYRFTLYSLKQFEKSSKSTVIKEAKTQYYRLNEV